MQLVEIAENPVPPDAILHRVRSGRAEIRVARWAARSQADAVCPGTVVICTGRAEFIEKYGEVVGELLERGFAVVAFDWRGQGGSSRMLGNRRKGHVGSFEDYGQDLDALGEAVLQPFCPKPWFALAHSMGGAILIHHAARADRLFQRIVLTAPMVEIHALKAPRLTRMLTRIVTAVGFGGFYVPGGSNQSEMSKPFPGNVLTSDPTRHARFAALARAAPDLAVGAPTWGWLNAAFRCMARFTEAEFPRRIVTPILVLASGADRVVNTRATERFATRLKAGGLILVPQAEHEVLMEQDRFRAQFWSAFDAFIPGGEWGAVTAEPRGTMAG